MKRKEWAVVTSASVQEWRPDLLMKDAEDSDLLQRVALDIRNQSHKTLVDKYRVERNQDWAELSHQVVGGESI